MKKNKIFFVLIIITLLSCNKKTVNFFVLTKESTIKIKADSSITTPYIKTIPKTHFVMIEDSLIMYFVDYNGGKLVLFNLVSNKYGKINISQLSLNKTNNDIYPLIHNKDSIFFHFNDAKKIILTDFNGNILKEINTTEKVSEFTQAFFNYNFEYYNNKLSIMYSQDDIILDTITSFQKYFHRKCHKIIDISSNMPKYYNVLDYPNSYKKGMYFGDTYHNFCVNKKGETIYSFSADNYIYLYKDSVLIRKIEATFSKTQTFNLYDYANHKMDFSYKNNYMTTEPKYLSIIYDGYRNIYYRILKLRMPQNTINDIKKNTIKNGEWVLIALNKNFKKIAEQVFKFNENIPVIYPIKEGLLIGKSIENTDTLNHFYEFDIFKFTVSE